MIRAYRRADVRKVVARDGSVLAIWRDRVSREFPALGSSPHDPDDPYDELGGEA